jgi:hypothetical protein
VVDFQKGERYVWFLTRSTCNHIFSVSRQINMDYSICKALSFNMEGIPVALVMYDIMCQYRVHFQE